MLNEIISDWKKRTGLFRSSTRVPTDQDLRAALNGPFRNSFPTNRDHGIAAPAPRGSFDTLTDAIDRQIYDRAGEDIRARRYFILPTAAAGHVGGYPIKCDGNGLMIVPRTMWNGNEIESSDSARVYVYINNEQYPVPFSFASAPQGSQKGDVVFFGGRINTLDFYVQNPDQGSLPQLIFVLLRNATMVGQFGSAQLYGSPSQPGSGGLSTSVSSAAPGGSPAPAPSPGPAPAPQPPSGGGGAGGGGGPILPGGGGGYGGKQTL